MGVPYTLEEHMKYGPTASYKSISKRSLWKDNDIRFPSCSFESPAVYALVLALAGEVAYVPEPLYYYRRFRENSLVETAYAKAPGVADNTLGTEAMAHLVAQFERHGLAERYARILPGLAAYRLNDILAMQYHRRSAEDFAELVANQRAFMAQAFPQLPQWSYITWGGYNLNKVMQHLPMLNDPSCRFNFSSIAAVCHEEVQPFEAHHPNRYREMMLRREADCTFWEVLRREQPRYVFMDLMDERFDLIKWHGRYVTASDAFEGAETDVVPERVLAFGSEEHFRAWTASFDEFAGRLIAEIPKSRIVVVDDYLCREVGSIDGTVPFKDLADIDRINAGLGRFYGHIREHHPEALMVDARACEGYFTDRAYEYGAYPWHLNEIVNQRIAAKIARTVGITVLWWR